MEEARAGEGHLPFRPKDACVHPGSKSEAGKAAEVRPGLQPQSPSCPSTELGFLPNRILALQIPLSLRKAAQERPRISRRRDWLSPHNLKA